MYDAIPNTYREASYEHYFFGGSNKNNAGNAATIEQAKKAKRYSEF